MFRCSNKDLDNFYIILLLQTKFYTIIMLDPDAPNNNRGQFYLHWIVSNVPVNNLKIYFIFKLCNNKSNNYRVILLSKDLDLL